MNDAKANGEAAMAPVQESWLRLSIAAFATALAGSAVVYAAAGPTLGLFLGGMLLAAVGVPTLCLGASPLLHRLIIAASVCDGIAIVWIVPLFNSPLTLVQWLLCYVLLIAWCTALLGAALVFSRFARDPIPAGAAAVC
jgi:hypothetical protein